MDKNFAFIIAGLITASSMLALVNVVPANAQCGVNKSCPPPTSTLPPGTCPSAVSCNPPPPPPPPPSPSPSLIPDSRGGFDFNWGGFWKDFFGR
jgi:hypothetical protein